MDDIKVEESSDKQFVTLQSKNGNYFYLVIDRAGDKENVYFLNLVDEADLMALIEDKDKKTEPPKVCTCSEKCETGKVKSDCPLCVNDLNQCVGKATEPAETAPEKKSNTGNLLIILLLIGGLGGAFYFFKTLSDNGETDQLDITLLNFKGEPLETGTINLTYGFVEFDDEGNIGDACDEDIEYLTTSITSALEIIVKEFEESIESDKVILEQLQTEFDI